MCFTRKMKREKKRVKLKKNKIYPMPPAEFTMDETIRCQGCLQKFTLMR